MICLPANFQYKKWTLARVRLGIWMTHCWVIESHWHSSTRPLVRALATALNQPEPIRMSSGIKLEIFCQSGTCCHCQHFNCLWTPIRHWHCYQWISIWQQMSGKENLADVCLWLSLLGSIHQQIDNNAVTVTWVQYHDFNSWNSYLLHQVILRNQHYQRLSFQIFPGSKWMLLQS